MFSDVLPPLAGLSRAFQKKDIDFTVVKPLVVGTKATIEALLLTPGEFFQSLSDKLSDLEEYGVQQPSDSMIDSFKHDVYEKYLRTLSEHIPARFPDLSLFLRVLKFSILAIFHKSSPFNPSMVLTCWISLSLSMVHMM